MLQARQHRESPQLISQHGVTSDEESRVSQRRSAEGSGSAVLSVAPETLYTVRDREGNVVMGSVPVTDGALGLPEGAPAPIDLRVAPSIVRTHATVSFGTTLAAASVLRVFDVRGRQVTALTAPEGASAIRWDATDAVGRHVQPGVYHARLDGVSRPLRLVVLR